MAFPFVSWAEGLSTEIGLNLSEDLFFWSSPSFGQKIGLNLSEDLFLFGLQLILDRKIGLILGDTIFILNFVLLKFSEFPAPPSFQNPAYATAGTCSIFSFSAFFFCRSFAFHSGTRKVDDGILILRKKITSQHLIICTKRHHNFSKIN